MKKTSIFLIALVFALGLGLASYSYAANSKPAIDGYCPVCVSNGMAMKGDSKFATEYKGNVYLFVGFKQQKMFINDPETYIAGLEEKYQKLGKQAEGSGPEEGSR